MNNPYGLSGEAAGVKSEKGVKGEKGGPEAGYRRSSAITIGL
jgi:hypothetical protein